MKKLILLAPLYCVITLKGFVDSLPYVKIETQAFPLGKLMGNKTHIITSNFKVNKKYYDAIGNLYIGKITFFDQNVENEIDATPFEDYIIEQYNQKKPWYEKGNTAFIGASCFFGCTTILFGYLWWKKK